MAKKLLLILGFSTICKCLDLGIVNVEVPTEVLNLELVWKKFKKAYQKNYDDPIEDTTRQNTFIETLNTIDKHNELFDKGISSFQMGINQFSDMTLEEALTKSTGFRNDSVLGASAAETYVPTDSSVPLTFNWAQSITPSIPVRDQGSCGSCYAFSAIGQIEFQQLIRNNLYCNLSTQYIVDCSQAYNNYGCSGGLMEDVFKFLIDTGQTVQESSYPYTAKVGQCHSTNETTYAPIKGYKKVSILVTNIIDALYNVGPLAAALCVNDFFIKYKSGVYKSEGYCKKPNHAVILVGYFWSRSICYFYVKNSWGENWGESGYFRIECTSAFINKLVSFAYL